jgi:uncharacterized protein DUF1206
MPATDSKFLLLTRIGFAARGLMYLLVAYLAVRLGRAQDAGEALEYLKTGAGRAVLATMAVGFAAFAAWRLLDAALDCEHRGNGLKALGVRIAHAGSGLIHGGLGFKSAKMALGGASRGGSSEAAEASAATALTLPGGDWLLTAGAAVLLGVAVVQFSHAVRRRYVRHLRPEARGKWWVIAAGSGGYAARGIIFAMAAWLLYRASVSHSPADAGGLGDALINLPGTLRTAVAAGLALFGTYSLIEAWYRVMVDPKVKERLKQAVA